MAERSPDSERLATIPPFWPNSAILAPQAEIFGDSELKVGKFRGAPEAPKAGGAERNSPSLSGESENVGAEGAKMAELSAKMVELGAKRSESGRSGAPNARNFE